MGPHPSEIRAERLEEVCRDGWAACCAGDLGRYRATISRLYFVRPEEYPVIGMSILWIVVAALLIPISLASRARRLLGLPESPHAVPLSILIAGLPFWVYS